MSNKVFVGGIPWSADDSDLEMAFSHLGQVKEAKVVLDRDSGKSRGFGFVTFEDETDAASAVEVGELTMDGRTVRIDLAEDKGSTPKDRRRGGGGGRR